MYLSADTKLLRDQRQDAAADGARSRQCADATRRMIATGRAQLFETIISPGQALDQFGIGTAVNVAKLQAESLDSRAALLSNGETPPEKAGPSIQDFISGAPQVVPLNATGSQAACSGRKFYQQPLPPDPSPSMPSMAPDMVQTDMGTFYFRGAAATQSEGQGLTGYAPSWSDAFVRPNGGTGDTGVMGWIQSNPWLALAIAGAGLFALSRKSGGRR